MSVNMDLSWQGRGTEERSFIWRFDNPHSARRLRRVIFGGVILVKPNAKSVRTPLCSCSSRCSGSACSAPDLAGRLVIFGCCAGLSLRLGTETLTALVKFGKQLCKMRCSRGSALSH